MGSRAVVVLCRDEDVARRRFVVIGEGVGIITTRTGRRFFDDPAIERDLLAIVHGAATRSGLWERLERDGVVLNYELMRCERGTAARSDGNSSGTRGTVRRGVSALLLAVESVSDLRLAPFHVLASEGAVHVDKDHAWHMTEGTLLCAADDSGVLFATAHRLVDLTDTATENHATTSWEELTSKGGEGMVVKPMSFVARGRRGLVQPAVRLRRARTGE